MHGKPYLELLLVLVLQLAVLATQAPPRQDEARRPTAEQSQVVRPPAWPPCFHEPHQ